MEIKGTIDQLFDKETNGNYTSRKLWLTTNEQYPQKLQMECGGKKADLFDNLQTGQALAVEVNINGREHNGKRYMNLSAWKIN